MPLNGYLVSDPTTAVGWKSRAHKKRHFLNSSHTRVSGRNDRKSTWGLTLDQSCYCVADFLNRRGTWLKIHSKHIQYSITSAPAGLTLVPTRFSYLWTHVVPQDNGESRDKLTNVGWSDRRAGRLSLGPEPADGLSPAWLCRLWLRPHTLQHRTSL